ncbi:reverse transcriptase domain-containing protein [Tanacetum coccineum]
MTIPVKKRNNNKFCEFHGEAGHNTDECMHLKRQIEELLKNGKLSHVIKELKQNSGKDQPKTNKKWETSNKDKALAILMVQPWQRVARQRITKSFSPNPEISFPPLEEEEGTEGPMIIEAEIRGHFIHLVKIGDEEHSTSAWMNFVIVRLSFPYNGIIGRPGVRKIQAVPSTTHRMLKFPIAGGILTLKSSKIIPIKCAAVSGPEGQPPTVYQAIEERIKVAINLEYPEQTIMIGSTLIEEGRNKLCDLLQRNLDVFAWKPADMTGVPRHIAEHRLNLRKGCLPVRQEVKKQMRTRPYKKKLKNSLMLHDGSWRMCVDFKDLNKACLKDGYPLPEIYWKVESLCGFTFKCFLDAYKGYHQIKMAKEDEEKTTFITNQGIFCYSKMPFGLRNVGATYQRLVDKAFHKQVGRNLEVYVDDLVIKSRTKDEIIRDIEETFKTLREINIKLDPKMYLRGRRRDVHRIQIQYQRNKVHKKSDFHRTEEAESAFKQMKQLIAKLPTLTAPEEKKELIVYLAAAKEAVSAVLMTEREAKQMEKLVLALVHVSKRLKRYFQAHPIIVITDQPIKQVFSRPKVAGRLQKWSIELGEYSIHYRPRVSVKGQILADFIVERPEEDSPDTPMEVEEELPEPWILFMDGSSCADGSGAGLILTNLEGAEFTYALRFRFEATNNEAEYEALIAGLRIAKEMGVKNLHIRTDALSKITSTSFAHLSKQVLVEEIKEKSINELEVLVVVKEEEDTWMTPIYKYLTEETLPTEVSKARAVRRKSQWFAVISGVLYKKYFLGPWLRSIVAKALRTGYYWPTMHKDARALIRACQDFQVHRPVPRNPQQKLTPITSPWPFYKWGIDIAEPFSKGLGKVKFLIVAIDYFTKWIEVKLVATKDNPFKDWCEKLCIRQRFASVKHPQANGLVERANRSLGEGIKARLDARNKNWMEEISHVLWAHRTMIKSSNGDTPFSLTYGMEAVIPAEIGMPTLRIVEVDMVHNDEALEVNLELLEERREQAAIREAKSKAKMEKILQLKGPQHKLQARITRVPVAMM